MVQKVSRAFGGVTASHSSEKFTSAYDDTLKLVGAFSMLVDHIGLIFFPQIELMRIVGRLAFPIFSWYLVQGFIHTRSLPKYIGRIGVLAIASQVPFYLLTRDAGNLNILFSFVLGLIALHGWKHYRPLTVIGALVVAWVYPVDYSYYGILIILSFYVFSRSRTVLFSQFAINIIGALTISPVQLFSLAGTSLIYWYRKTFPRIEFRLGKRFFYIFYPTHLSVLWVLWYFCNR